MKYQVGGEGAKTLWYSTVYLGYKGSFVIWSYPGLL